MKKWRDLTGAQLQKIEGLYRACVPPEKAATELGIELQAVKQWYRMADKGGMSEAEAMDSDFLEVFLEAARLLAWPTPKVLSKVGRFRQPIEGLPPRRAKPTPFLQKDKEVQDESTRPTGPCERTFRRYLRHRNPGLHTTSCWKKGTAAVHAVPIKWYQHSRDGRAILTKPEGKVTPGWLLLLADRHCGRTRKREPWTLAVHVAVFPGEELDRTATTRCIVEHLNAEDSGVRELHLVCGEDEIPTATAPAEELRPQLPDGIEVVLDPPTTGIATVGTPFQLRLAFPSPRSVENYLNVMLEYRGKFPVPEDFRRDLRRLADREDFSTENFLRPYRQRWGCS